MLLLPKEQLFLFSTVFYYLLLDIHLKTGTRFSLRDKRLFEISEVGITRVDCFVSALSLEIIIYCISVCCISLNYLQ